MKKTNLKQILNLFVLSFFVCAFSSCTNSQEAFLYDFYTDCVFGDNPNQVKILEENTSKRLLKILRDNYEYDCESENCYAWWYFSTGHQDSDPYAVDTTGLAEIINLKNDWYRVRFFHMGWKGSNRIKFVEVNGKKVMDEIIDDRGVDPFTYEGGKYVKKD